jgi:predicted negative regulator of RcsB-dependent stress response
MNTAERHRLKDNEIAQGLARAGDAWENNSKTILQAVGVAALVGVLALGYWYWQRRQAESASALLAKAMVTASRPVAPAATPAVPGQPAPVVPKNAFPTEAARSEAALKEYEAAAAAYPSTSPGLTARLQAASLLAELGRGADAEKHFAEVVRLDGNGLYGRMATLGLATIQIDGGKLDPAIAALSALAQRTDLEVPVDGVLMQLGRAYAKAGKTADAIRTFSRISDEFPDSPYAGDARTETDRLKAGATGA